MFSAKPRLIILGSILVVASAVLVGCSSSGSSGTGTTATAATSGGQSSTSSATNNSTDSKSTFGTINKNAPLYNDLPSAIKAAGVLKNASDMTYPPYEFYSSAQSVVGAEPDLSAALSAQLGVPISWTNLSTPNALLALSADRVDMSMQALTITPVRAQKYDFVLYMKSSHGAVVLADNASKAKNATDLCGKPLAVNDGTSSANYVSTVLPGICKKAGLPADQVITVGSRAQALTTVKTGRAFAMIDIAATAAYSLKQERGQGFVEPSLRLVGGQYGVALRKNEVELRDVLQKAFIAIQQNGDYQKVLLKWDMSDDAVSTFGTSLTAINTAQ